jgi:hypothetical protein
MSLSDSKRQAAWQIRWSSTRTRRCRWAARDVVRVIERSYAKAAMDLRATSRCEWDVPLLTH